MRNYIFRVYFYEAKHGIEVYCGSARQAKILAQAQRINNGQAFDEVTKIEIERSNGTVETIPAEDYQ